MDILSTSAAPARLTFVRDNCGGGACGDALLSRSARCGVSLVLEKRTTHSLSCAIPTFSLQGRYTRRAPGRPAE